MTWAAVRTAIRDILQDTQVLTPTAETLNAYEFAPGGRQDLAVWPYCFLMPAGREVVQWEPGGQEVTKTDVLLRFMLAPVGVDDMQWLHQRYEAWQDGIKAVFRTALALNYTSDGFETLDLGALVLFDDLDKGWGFEFTLGQVRLGETVTVGG